MKKIILIFFISLLSLPSWSDTITFEDLVKRNNLYYKKYTDIPFTGEVTGKEVNTTKFKKEHSKKVRKCKWLSFYDNGQLNQKRHYKNGKLDGLWETFEKEETYFPMVIIK